MTKFGVLCHQADGGHLLVEVDADTADGARQQVLDHKALGYGPGDAAGRWLAHSNPSTIVEVCAVRPLADWLAEA